MFKPLTLPDCCHTGSFGGSLDGDGVGAGGGAGGGGLIGCPVCMVL